MLSLVEQSFLKETENINGLAELLALCSSSNQFKVICYNSPNFWKIKLDELFGNILVLKRKDLVTGGEWFYFAQALAKGIQYDYGIRMDARNSKLLSGPGPQKMLQLSTDDARDILTASASIDGTLPKPGSIGYLVEFDFSKLEPYRFSMNKEEWFIGTSEEETRNVMLTFIAETLWNQLRFTDLSGQMEVSNHVTRNIPVNPLRNLQSTIDAIKVAYRDQEPKGFEQNIFIEAPEFNLTVIFYRGIFE